MNINVYINIKTITDIDANISDIKNNISGDIIIDINGIITNIHNCCADEFYILIKLQQDHRPPGIPKKLFHEVFADNTN